MSENLLTSFEKACIKVINDPNFNRGKYLSLKKDKIPLLTLKPKFKPIAKKYIPFTGTTTDRFPAEVIVKISSIMGVT